MSHGVIVSLSHLIASVWPYVQTRARRESTSPPPVDALRNRDHVHCGVHARRARGPLRADTREVCTVHKIACTHAAPTRAAVRGQAAEQVDMDP